MTMAEGLTYSERDLKQVGHTAQNAIPGRIIGRLGPIQNLLDTDAQPFLTTLEVLQNALAGHQRTTLFAELRQRVLKLVLLVGQTALLLDDAANLLIDHGQPVLRLGEFPAALIADGPAVGNLLIQMVASLFGGAQRGCEGLDPGVQLLDAVF